PVGQPITIDGLWGLAFGKGGEEDNANTLFFAAGINDEADGLFVTLRPADTDGPVGGARSSSGRTEIAAETAALIASLPTRAEAPRRAVQSSAAAPADPMTGTGDPTVLTPAPPRQAGGKRNLRMRGAGAAGWHVDPRDADYRGKPLKFLIAPAP